MKVLFLNYKFIVFIWWHGAKKMTWRDMVHFKTNKKIVSDLVAHFCEKRISSFGRWICQNIQIRVSDKKNPKMFLLHPDDATTAKWPYSKFL